MYETMSEYGIKSNGVGRVRHTAVTFLTLMAVMPLSLPFLDSIAASLIKLDSCQFEHKTT